MHKKETMKVNSICLRQRDNFFFSNILDPERGSRFSHNLKKKWIKKKNPTTFSPMYSEHIFFTTNKINKYIIKNMTDNFTFVLGSHSQP